MVNTRITKARTRPRILARSIFRGLSPHWPPVPNHVDGLVDTAARPPARPPPRSYGTIEEDPESYGGYRNVDATQSRVTQSQVNAIMGRIERGPTPDQQQVLYRATLRRGLTAAEIEERLLELYNPSHLDLYIREAVGMLTRPGDIESGEDPDTFFGVLQVPGAHGVDPNWSLFTEEEKAIWAAFFYGQVDIPQLVPIAQVLEALDILDGVETGYDFTGFDENSTSVPLEPTTNFYRANPQFADIYAVMHRLDEINIDEINSYSTDDEEQEEDDPDGSEFEDFIEPAPQNT